MSLIQKSSIVPILAFLTLASACGPTYPDVSGIGKGIGEATTKALACALSSALGFEEVFYLPVDLDSLSSQFLVTVKPLDIKSVEAFEASAPTEAKEFIKSIVDQEFEKLGVAATQSMHAKVFYYRLVTRALLSVIYDSKPQGNWRFVQAEFIETSPKEKEVNMVSLYLSIQKIENLDAKSDQNYLSLDHEAVVFCGK